MIRKKPKSFVMTPYGASICQLSTHCRTVSYPSYPKSGQFEPPRKTSRSLKISQQFIPGSRQIEACHCPTNFFNISSVSPYPFVLTYSKNFKQLILLNAVYSRTQIYYTRSIRRLHEELPSIVNGNGVTPL